MKRQIFCTILLLVPITAFSESFAGKWLIETEALPGQFPGHVRTILELSQVGEKVAGTMSVVRSMSALSLPPPTQQRIYGAKVDGKTLTFYVWTPGDEPLKDIYKGVLTDKGEISFEVERGVGPPRAVPPKPDGGAGQSAAPGGTSRVTAVPVL